MDMQIEGNTVRKVGPAVYAKQETLCKVPVSCAPIAFSLDEDGFIQECSKSVEKLFGYHEHELIWQHISCLFPQLTEVALMKGDRLNPLFQYICHCGHAFEAINKLSDVIKCNLNFFLIENEGVPTLRLIVRPLASAA